MEVEMEEQALEVVERLVSEDDQSVEAWYLGGWCLHLLGQKRQREKDHMDRGPELQEIHLASLVSSRDWLQQSLTLYRMLEYEDDRLRDHAVELVGGLDQELEGHAVDEDQANGIAEGDWESENEEGEDEDQEMKGT